MRIDTRAIARFLDAPGGCRAVLLHGDDSGLVRERGATLTRAVAGTLDDPFRVAALDRDGHDRLLEEATALSMMPGRRVVRVRDATDALAPVLARALDAGGDTLLVLEAGALPARSKLRLLLEPHGAGAVIACYPDEGRDRATAIAAMVREAGCRIEPDALVALASVLGADRLASRSEIEKLALFVGEHGTIDVDAVELCVGDGAALSLDDALFAATDGDVAAADRALERALADGATPVAIARATLGHLARLRAARSAMERDGSSASDASKAARPPVFFKRSAAFTRALARWSAASLARAAAETHEVELACKRSFAPDEALVRHLVARIARTAAGRRPGASGS